MIKNQKEKLIRDIETDLEEIDYIKRNYELESLTDKELKEISLNIGNVWLLIQKLVRV